MIAGACQCGAAGQCDRVAERLCTGGSECAGETGRPSIAAYELIDAGKGGPVDDGRPTEVQREIKPSACEGRAEGRGGAGHRRMGEQRERVVVGLSAGRGDVAADSDASRRICGERGQRECLPDCSGEGCDAVRIDGECAVGSG